MKIWIKRLWFPVTALVLVLVWLVYFENAAVAAKLPHWGWLQSAVARLGQKVPETPAEDEDPDNTKNEIPVHTATISVATLHRYVEGYGTVVPRPARNGQMAGSANVASPVAGVVAKVSCQIGQKVHAGDVLIQLDDRQAKSAEDQAAAGLAQAQASLAAVKATPRPDQLGIAELAVSKAKELVDFDLKNFERLQKLAADGGTATKTVEQAAQDLKGAQNDLEVNQRQLALLKASPTPEDLHQEEAKVAQAAATLETVRTQRLVMAIAAPIDATVVALSINPGEPVDSTKTLVQLVAMDRLMVDVDVPAEQLPATAEGLAVQVLPTSAKPTEETAAQAKVTFVTPQVDPKNGSVMVGIDLPGDTKLLPGLTVRVRIIAEEHKDCLAVPREAVINDENGDSVIALIDGDQAMHKTVKAGLEENGLIEIQADGLKEGATVATAGAYGLPQATHVKVVQ